MSDMQWSEEFVSTPAMTLREYYAGQAMNALAVHSEFGDDTPAHVAELSAEYADALIAALQEAGDG